VEILQLPAFTSLLSYEYPATEFTHPAWGPRYIASGRTQPKTPPSAVFYFYLRLRSNTSDIVGVFTDRYQTTHVPSLDLP
jgi:hypothetical protein